MLGWFTFFFTVFKFIYFEMKEYNRRPRSKRGRRYRNSKKR